MPLPVISIAQMREWEKATWASGQTEAEVIRRVGVAVAERALQLSPRGGVILILAGRGHNGDDARAACEHLRGRNVEMMEVRDPAADYAKLDSQLARDPEIIIDGLFGIGINRPLDGPWIRFVERINSARGQVLAVDVPSGLNGDTGEPQGAAIEASVTLTVGAPKVGLLRSSAWPFVGRLEVAADVGLIPCPAETELKWTLAGDFAGFPPRRPVAGHKGSFGHVAILAGSAGYHGAAVLAARSAQRAQPGLITLFPHEPAYAPAAAQLQAVMVQSWSATVNLPGDFDAILAGPGLASSAVPEEMKAAVSRLWATAPVPVVADASALAWLPRDAAPTGAVRVVTPHPGEAARILQTGASLIQANRAEALRQLSRRLGNCWVILKGHQTLVGRSTGDVYVNSSGNPHLAQGGSGDALGGFLAGLLAQPALQDDVLKTLRYAVWQHGATADALQGQRRNWVVEDLLEALGNLPDVGSEPRL